MRNFLNFLFIIFFSLNTIAQSAPVQGKGQAQGTYQSINRFETPNSGVTVTGDKQVLLESDPENLLVNPGFEHLTFGTGWTVNAGTATVDTTNFYDGKKSMSIALTAVTGDILTQCVTPTGQKAGVNFANSLRVKTTLTNLQVCSLLGSTEVQCVAAASSDQFINAIATSTGPPAATPICVKLKSTSAATGTVKVDSGYVGINRNIGSVNQPRNVVQISWSGSLTASHDTDNKVTFASATVSKLECFSFSSGTLTALCDGDFEFIQSVRQTGVVDASTQRQSITKLYRNGTMIRRGGSIFALAGNNINSGGTGGLLPDQGFTTTIPVVAGQTFEVYYYQANGSGLSRSIEAATWEVNYFPVGDRQVAVLNNLQKPTVTRITTGSGTYTTPAGVTSLRVRMTGGGGGSNGNSGTACTSGSNGNSTTFGNATAIQGLTGALQGACQGQSLSSNTNTITGAISIVDSPSVCGQGGSSANASAQAAGGNGGSNFLAIGGVGSAREVLGTVGRFGGGGGGTGSFANATFMGCGGGNSGGYLEFLIPNPAATYAYSIGTGGAGGVGSRQNGVAGGDGIILIDEYYGANIPLSLESLPQFKSISANYTAQLTDETLYVDASGGARTITLPAAALQPGKKYTIIHQSADANAVIIDPNGSELVCGSSTVRLTGSQDMMEIQSNGANWVGLGNSCWRTETAIVSSAGVVSSETHEFLNGNCTGASAYTCSFISGVWSAAPNCWGTTKRVGGLNRTIDVYSESTSSVLIATATANGGSSILQSEAFTLACMGLR